MFIHIYSLYIVYRLVGNLNKV